MHLVSDLDGTWLPGPGRRADLAKLEAFLDRQPDIVLSFATGRTLDSALTVLTGLGARLPRYLITDVGTAVHQRDAQGRWRERAAYARWVTRRWNPAAVAGALLGRLPAGVAVQDGVLPCRRLALSTAPGSNLQALARNLRRTLAAAGVEADVLASAERCLDVLPRGVHKGTAVEFLQRRDRLPRPLVVCGDSGNDVGMLVRADLAVLMAGHSLSAPPLPRERLIQARAPGPLGILAALLALAERR